MEQIKNMLEAREKQLLQIKKEKEKALQNVPEGKLRVCCNGSKTQYYHRTDPKDFNGTYIRTRDLHKAQKLAQKDYDQKILQSIEAELAAIKEFQINYPEQSPEQIYETLHAKRQKLIMPIYEPEEEFVKNWESIEYQGKGFYIGAPELYTAKGERVRSKSEIIIADLLRKEGVPYRYECPIYLEGVGQIYPDFTVLNIKKRETLYWEHFGMMDDPEYVEKALKKIASYERNGIYQGEKLILTYETRQTPINQKQLIDLVEHYLK